MSRVDFYVLSAEAPDARLRYACRLAERAVEQGCHVYIQTQDVQRVDDMLWTFSDGSFLPHEIYRGQPASHERVKVMLGPDAGPASHRSLLINLVEAMPSDVNAYERIAEIVDVDPERKRSARERYKQYRELGCTLESHNL
ncbi:MAG TPA: DNA polymerase III subunit chi [Steroidobacter sp.]|uniref:DNA polymerase III subunit chi n=1 Tax=Steroidobacter sp. TaxID=1978227 RepID=UPI002ED95ECD